MQATQRFNEIRFWMKLREILWDFEASHQAIVAAWYMCDTGQCVGGPETKPREGHPAWGEHVVWAQRKTNRLPYWSYSNPKLPLGQVLDSIRAGALTRMSLLNPDARRLWLAQWDGAGELERVQLYELPRGEYRKDIATPSARTRGTVAEDRDLWRDVEETLRLDRGGSALVSKYPYDDESDAPWQFGHGAFSEYGWDDPVIKQTGLFSFGAPISLRFVGGVQLTDVDYDIRRKKGCPISVRKYLTGDKRVELGELPTVLLLPERPLDRETAYTVRIKGKLDGTPFDYKWEFTTRAK